MKKIIVFICTSICLYLCLSNVEAMAGFDINIFQNVEGVVGSILSNPEVILTVQEPANVIFNEEKIGEDVTDWFTNIPANTNYTAEISDVTDGGLTCYVQFSGDIERSAEPLEEQIAATVTSSESEQFLLFNYAVEEEAPDYYDGSIEVVKSDAAKYIITEDFTIQYDGPYTVSGYVGEELTPQVVKVEITSNTDKFNSAKILNSILSTPNGLTATVTECSDPTHITITYTGTPIVTSQDLIHTTVPKIGMNWNVKDRIVPDRADVKFDIIDRIVPTPDPEPTYDDPPVYEAPKTGIN